MGEVWRATDTVLGREVAVKLLKAEYADDPTFRSRFETEARHAAALHHPDVAAVFDFGEAAADRRLRRAPALPGDGAGRRPAALGAAARPAVPLDPDATRDLLAQAADALGAAHARRHRAPRRQAGQPAGHPRPARSRSPTSASPAPPRASALTETGQVMGTPQYLSPEQAAGRAPPRPASDVYSLGVVAFECLAGRRPFVGRDRRSPPRWPTCASRCPTCPTTVPADLAAVVRRALAKDPEERFRRRRGLRRRAAQPGDRRRRRGRARRRPPRPRCSAGRGPAARRPTSTDAGRRTAERAAQQLVAAGCCSRARRWSRSSS